MSCSDSRSHSFFWYKDDVQFPYPAPNISIKARSDYDIGYYQCLGSYGGRSNRVFLDIAYVIITGSSSKTFAAEEYISVAELFTSPEIRLSLQPVMEEADMTLTCHTTRSQTKYTLSFAFYKDGKIVQDFGKSNKYIITAAGMEDSGSYTCEVSSGTVKKISKPVSVQGLAVVSFTPNFGKILTTENMTLTCNVDPKIRDKQEYFWYKDGIRMDRTHQSFTIQDAGVSDSGYYQCRSTNTHMSEPLRLDVSNGDVVLQGPLFILEGDNVTFSCHHRQGYHGLPLTAFYKNNILIRFPETSSDLQLTSAEPSMNGIYKCVKHLPEDNITKILHSTELLISVKDLIRNVMISGYGGDLHLFFLSCKAEIIPTYHLLRDRTKLEFAIYKDGNIVQDYGISRTYLISKGDTKPSGNYSCGVKYLSRYLRRSEELVIMGELFITPLLVVKPPFIQHGKPMAITCDYPDELNSGLSTQLRLYLSSSDPQSAPPGLPALTTTSPCLTTGLPSSDTSVHTSFHYVKKVNTSHPTDCGLWKTWASEICL
ncbi:hypothetical protein GDO81_022994 [Engystomops pustulosus]|uniref:Ig-like domain-containing protein n=1 Tax=Engystomops pustulosus TaxID=76066 RepID=A0AAV6ZIB0_ENGPU|nr:hypothetical protein GDO81_022994 [Engystomops pustulosus]